MTQKPLSESQEMYLKTIQQIVETKGAARVRDIAEKMKVGYPSVTGALKALSERGLVNYAPYDVVTLTERGERTALDILRRHAVLRRFLVEVLSIDGKEADQTACRMEHVVSKKVLGRLVDYLHYMESCPFAQVRWIDRTGYRCEGERGREECERCASVRIAETNEGSESNTR
ncbi:MAG: metal-dependent transcriptional regulator [Candidatus Eisenbacteria bacterium]|nr:metal-dependent transcriptional regulator [Candidatus Latescibacterota bacterium]MBD3301576.1 metal-dependent transcriptional regulator [Candidatus Eisenbacteria bacterium]